MVESRDAEKAAAGCPVGAATSGFDGGKKIRGRKRQLAVDSNGWLLAVLVTAVSVQDRDGGHRLVALLRERFSTTTLVGRRR